MKKWSIKIKLIMVTAALVIATTVTLLATIDTFLSRSFDAQSHDVLNEMQSEIQKKLLSTSGQYANVVSAYINEAFSITAVGSNILHATAKGEPLNRDRLMEITKAAIEASEHVSAIYISFEPNQYDGLDQAYVGKGLMHSTDRDGEIEVYMARMQNGSIATYNRNNADNRQSTEVNEFGEPMAEWWLCAKTQRKPCILEPYIYEISDSGEFELMTSVTLPIQKEGKFIGMIGVDINLDNFWELTKELSNKLYDGKSRVTIISTKHQLIAGASHYEDSLGRPLKEVTTIYDSSMFTNESAFKETENSFLLSYPIHIELANTDWHLLVEAPKADALAQVHVLERSLTSKKEKLTTLLIAIGIFAVFSALVFIWIVMNSISAPIKSIQKRVENLVSMEGDLTQSINVDSHEELIQLSSGFNAFINRLKVLIYNVKELTIETAKHSSTAKDIATQANDSITQQKVEIEHLVSAVKELNTTAGDVARASEDSAVATNQINNDVKEGQASIVRAVDDVLKMKQSVTETREAINQLADSSNNINSILDVIRSIAEQTNLLALNAAIEAARAGEQGRGFAVVADEVRALASKTQASINDISHLISNLHSEVEKSSEVIESSVSNADNSVKYTKEASNNLNNIADAIKKITEQIDSIAALAEKQSAVAGRANSTILSLSDGEEALAELINQAQNGAVQLAELTRQQTQHLEKLKT